MGREFVVDPWEEHAWTSCTCSEASPFNCTCPRVDPTSMPPQSMPHETIPPAARPVRPTIMLPPPRPRPSYPVRPSTLVRPMPPPPRRRPSRRPYIENAHRPSLPTPLNFAPNLNPRVRGSENIVWASASGTSNVEPARGIPVVYIPPVPRPRAWHGVDGPAGFAQLPDGRFLGVSQEFMNWANGRSRTEMINAVLEDDHILQSLGITTP